MPKSWDAVWWLIASAAQLLEYAVEAVPGLMYRKEQQPQIVVTDDFKAKLRNVANKLRELTNLVYEQTSAASRRKED